MTTAFSNTYAEARAKFLDLAAARDAAVISTVHPTECGAQGEELAIDIATFGDPAAKKTLFLVSGTHGQEGFYGSALQIEFLRELEIPDGVNVVALHALNPWGFSHLSRTDDRNIDINRNFIDHDQPAPRNDLYATLHDALCPNDWTEQTLDWSVARNAIAEDFGYQAMVTALAGGQTIEPSGLLYIGDRPSWSHEVVRDLLPTIFAGTQKIAFLEWHTGLGPRGELTQLCSMQPGTEGFDLITGWLGGKRTPFDDKTDLSKGETPAYKGLFSAWLPSTAPHAQWTGMLIEVGTYDNLTVQDAVRIDRWLRYGSGDSLASRDDLRRTMLEGLNPKSEQWRIPALHNGMQAQRATLAGLVQW